ncbi:MAG: hypothetical protein ACFB03_20050 [Paracoccaceae bacterium]
MYKTLFDLCSYGIHNVDIMRAADALKGLTVIHPYGSLGSLPWEDISQNVSFGGGGRNSGLLEIASGIRTFSEGLGEGSEIRAAIERSILSAERLVFLGFGYLPMNMDALNISTPERIRYVFGTSKGLSESDTRLVKSQIFNIFKPVGDIELTDKTCDVMFHEYWRSLSFTDP